jgi:hypothetical protein
MEQVLDLPGVNSQSNYIGNRRDPPSARKSRNWIEMTQVGGCGES